VNSARQAEKKERKSTVSALLFRLVRNEDSWNTMTVPPPKMKCTTWFLWSAAQK
jgi:hypothetical protein